MFERKEPLVLVAMIALASRAMAAPPELAGFELYTDSALTMPGLLGSYVNQSLRTYAPQDDWRTSQTISGTRVEQVAFEHNSAWGVRASVGVTGGPSDADWDLFSVQWDGYLSILAPGTRLFTISDDCSRMWIDLDDNGSFDATAPELLDNNWGSPQAPTRGNVSPHLVPGVYRIRIQYAEDYLGAYIKLAGYPATVRFAYVIPSNRSAQPTAIANLEDQVLPLLYRWHCDQMDRNGVGRIAPNFERDATGAFVAHLVSVAETDEVLRADLYGATIAAAAAAGLTVREGEVWLMIPETHRMHPDGTIDGVSSLGGGGDHTFASGVAITESAILELMNRSGALDDRPYGGLSFPTIGAYPLVQGVSFAAWGGPTISSNVSNIIGTLGHELMHGFGVAHDGRNEMVVGVSAHGNMMGTGFSDFRGAVFPERYPDQHMRATWSDAQQLALSSYFQACDGSGSMHSGGVLTADDQPALAISTAGDVEAIDGHVEIEATASDPDGLAMARLIWGGGYVDALVLTGTSATFELRSAYFTAGQANDLSVVVYDSEGNRRTATTSVTPQSTANQAPRASVIANPSEAAPGQMIELHAIPGTADDTTSAAELTFEWYFEAGGSAIPSGNDGSVSTTYATPGVRLVRVRVTDRDGASATSPPIAIRIAPACSDGLDNDGAPGTDFDAGASIFGAGNQDPAGADPECIGLPLHTRESNLQVVPTLSLPGFAGLAVLIALAGARELRRRRRPLPRPHGVRER